MDPSFTKQDVFCLLLWLVLSLFSASAQAVFINEFHYDNDGGDTGEAIEIAGVEGVDLSGWSLELYNGNNGATYNLVTLSGVIPDLQGGFGALSFFAAGMQNGSPDGLALVDDADNVVQFLSYEGSFTATSGFANGLSSTDIGVSEATNTPLGYSLQLAGTGSLYEDFVWAEASASTFGGINTGQTFFLPEVQNPNLDVSVPEPASVYLLGIGLIGLGLKMRNSCASQNRWRLAGNVPVLP